MLTDLRPSKHSMRHLFPGCSNARRKRTPRYVVAAMVMLTLTAPSIAQNVPADIVTFDPITVTATRRAERAFDVPASIDTIDAAALHNGQPQVNLSETLFRIPGVFAANRQ